GASERTRCIAVRQRIAFDAAGAVVDLNAVHRDAGAVPAAPSTEALGRAAADFRGEFLEGTDLPGCYRYHEWWVAERESLRGLRTLILAALVERLRDRPESALVHARDRVQIDPFSEAAHIAVIQLLNT